MKRLSSSSLRIVNCQFVANNIGIEKELKIERLKNVTRADGMCDTKLFLSIYLINVEQVAATLKSELTNIAREMSSLIDIITIKLTLKKRDANEQKMEEKYDRRWKRRKAESTHTIERFSLLNVSMMATAI